VTLFASYVSIGIAMGKPSKTKRATEEPPKKSTKDKDPKGPKTQGKDPQRSSNLADVAAWNDAHHQERKDGPHGTGSTSSTSKATDLPPQSRSALATTTSSSSRLGETAMDKARKAAASIKLKAFIAATKWPSTALAEAAEAALAFSKPPPYTAEDAPPATLTTATSASPGSLRTGEFSGSTNWQHDP
jgi:hypothetical protein